MSNSEQDDPLSRKSSQGTTASTFVNSPLRSLFSQHRAWSMITLAAFALAGALSPTSHAAESEISFSATPLLAQAFTSVQPEQMANNQASTFTWNSLRDKFRFRTFTEYMTPSITGNQHNVPTPEGTSALPTFTFNYAYIDYDIGNDWKVVYWQRFFTFFDTAPKGLTFRLRNPRFAIRKVNVFTTPGLATTYDLYLQPGLAPEGSNELGRAFEFGARTSTSYAIPKTNWSTGLITELTWSPYSPVKTSFDYYGWGAIWGSYQLSSVFATQHFFTLNFRHDTGVPLLQLSYDDPMPYIQNGVSMSVSSAVWLSVMLNNYVGVAPTLQNTWASLWASFTVL